MLELLRDHVKLLLGNARELIDRCCEVIKGRGVDHTVVEGEFVENCLVNRTRKHWFPTLSILRMCFSQIKVLYSYFLTNNLPTILISYLYLMVNGMIYLRYNGLI